jgi:hypothetical protein
MLTGLLFSRGSNPHNFLVLTLEDERFQFPLIGNQHPTALNFTSPEHILLFSLRHMVSFLILLQSHLPSYVSPECAISNFKSLTHLSLTFVSRVFWVPLHVLLYSGYPQLPHTLLKIVFWNHFVLGCPCTKYFQNTTMYDL